MQTSGTNKCVVYSGHKVFQEVLIRQASAPVGCVIVDCQGRVGIETQGAKVYDTGEDLVGGRGGRCPPSGISGKVIDCVEAMSNHSTRL